MCLEPTIGREIIAEVDINQLNFNLLIDEDSLWTGELGHRSIVVRMAN